MKIEFMQTVKQHEITKRQPWSRTSSRSSVLSHLSIASKAASRKENKINDNKQNQRGPIGHTFDAAHKQGKIDDQCNNLTVNCQLDQQRTLLAEKKKHSKSCVIQ